MPFYRTTNGHGWLHMKASRRSALPNPCRAARLADDDPKLGKYCSRVSVVVCDAVVGTDVAGNPATCDMPICEHHRQRAAKDVDYCPRHRRPTP